VVNGQGGLEHMNSTTLSVNRWTYSGSNYINFLNLVAHEYFHLWNVKRLRPIELGPFNYDQENYTNLLVVLAANIDGKAFVAVLIDDTLQTSKGLEAQKIIKDQIAPLIKGGGGGQKGLATAGGQDSSNLTQVIENVKNLLK
jgi:alanyl-tRNA synthetase